MAREILGLDTGPARKQLADVWDHETGLPLSARVENMNHGQVFHYQPWQILIYLTATKDNGDFQFKRTLDYFTYLLESEWGMNWNAEYDTSAGRRILAGQGVTPGGTPKRETF